MPLQAVTFHSGHTSGSSSSTVALPLALSVTSSKVEQFNIISTTALGWMLLLIAILTHSGSMQPLLSRLSEWSLVAANSSSQNNFGTALGAIASPLPQGGAEHSDRERALHAQCLIEFAPQAFLSLPFSCWCAVLPAVMLDYYIKSLHPIVIPSVSADLDSSVTSASAHEDVVVNDLRQLAGFISWSLQMLGLRRPACQETDCLGWRTVCFSGPP
jgi:hypothetical protein